MNTSFSKRIELSKRIRKKHKNKVPIIVDTIHNQLKLKKNRFIVSENLSMGALLSEVRKQAIVGSETAIFLFCGKNKSTLVPINHTISQVYEKYKDPDGFLYITAALENTFGTQQLIEYFLDSTLDNSGHIARFLGLHIF